MKVFKSFILMCSVIYINHAQAYQSGSYENTFSHVMYGIPFSMNIPQFYPDEPRAELHSQEAHHMDDTPVTGSGLVEEEIEEMYIPQLPTPSPQADRVAKRKKHRNYMQEWRKKERDEITRLEGVVRELEEENIAFQKELEYLRATKQALAQRLNR